jgi:hypothetical protein
VNAEIRQRLETILPDRLKDFGGMEAEWYRVAIELRKLDVLEAIRDELAGIKTALEAGNAQRSSGPSSGLRITKMGEGGRHAAE